MCRCWTSTASRSICSQLRQIPGNQGAEFRVQTAPQEASKSPAAAEKERQKILREAARKKRKGDPRSLEAAEYTIVLTSMGEEQLPAAEALELYRFRWQIEMVFKRLKGLLGLDQLAAKDSHLARSALY